MVSAHVNGDAELHELREEWDTFKGEVLAEVSRLCVRVDAQSTLLKRVNDQYADVVRNYRAVLERFDSADELRETTEIRNLRKDQLQRLRHEAEDAKEEVAAVTMTHARELGRAKRRTATWVGVAMLLAPAVVKLIEALAAHWK